MKKLHPKILYMYKKWYNLYMKYLSIFFTILLIWIAVILMAFTRQNTGEIYQLYLLVTICTTVMFLIGFAKK